MTKDPPDRISISIPSDAEIDRRVIERLVEASDAETTSEYIRQLLAEAGDGEFHK